MNQSEMENYSCCCDNCGKHFNFPNGIMAEIKNGCVVVESCSPATNISTLCNECVKQLNIRLW